MKLVSVVCVIFSSMMLVFSVIICVVGKCLSRCWLREFGL